MYTVHVTGKRKGQILTSWYGAGRDITQEQSYQKVCKRQYDNKYNKYNRMHIFTPHGGRL